MQSMPTAAVRSVVRSKFEPRRADWRTRPWTNRNEGSIACLRAFSSTLAQLRSAGYGPEVDPVVFGEGYDQNSATRVPSTGDRASSTECIPRFRCAPLRGRSLACPCAAQPRSCPCWPPTTVPAFVQRWEWLASWYRRIACGECRSAAGPLCPDAQAVSRRPRCWCGEWCALHKASACEEQWTAT